MSINLRRPTEAIIAPGSITSEQLAIGAVDLTSDKVIGELPNDKLASVALTSAKITGELPNNKLAVIEDVEKLTDNLITLAKASDDVKATSYVGGEVEQFVEGIIETALVETGFAKVAGKFVPQKLRVIASLKVVGASSDVATLNIYIDDEVSPRITLSSTDSGYELVSGEADISDLALERHFIVVKGVASEASAKCYNDYIDILFVK